MARKAKNTIVAQPVIEAMMTEAETMMANFAAEAQNDDAQMAIEPNLPVASDPGYADLAEEDMLVTDTDFIEALIAANGGAPVEEELIVAEAQADEAEAADQACFKDLVAAVTVEQAQQKAQDLVAAFAERAQFEIDADPTNSNIQKTLSKVQRAHLTPGVVAAMVVAGVDAGHINENEAGAKRRNVYALEKLRDLLYAAVTGHMKNAINIACMATLTKTKDLSALPFTGLVARGCASDKVAVPNDYKGYMTSHTVSAATASTQASSTMTALEVLGVVTNVGSRSHPIYKLTATPLSLRLQQVMGGVTA